MGIELINANKRTLELCVYFVCLGYTSISLPNLISQEINRLLKNGYFKADMEPVKCPKCDCEEFNDIVTDSIDTTVTEYDRKCDNCDYLMGCWGYGDWIQ